MNRCGDSYNSTLRKGLCSLRRGRTHASGVGGRSGANDLLKRNVCISRERWAAPARMREPQGLAAPLLLHRPPSPVLPQTRVRRTVPMLADCEPIPPEPTGPRRVSPTVNAPIDCCESPSQPGGPRGSRRTAPVIANCNQSPPRPGAPMKMSLGRLCSHRLRSKSSTSQWPKEGVFGPSMFASTAIPVLHCLVAP